MAHSPGRQSAPKFQVSVWKSCAARCFALGLILVAITACGGSEPPERIYQEWLGALETGDLEAAFETLSAQSKKRLVEAEELWVARGSDDFVQTVADPLVPKDDPAPQLLRKDREPGFLLFRRLAAGPGFGHLPPLPPEAQQRMKKVKIDGDRAVITVETPSGESEATLVLTDEGWRVALDLPPALP